MSTGDWVFIIVGVKNAYNEIHCIGMLWTIRHLWPSGARFVFNCYCHYSLLIFWNANKTAIFLHIREDVMQEDTYDMVAYGNGIIPLIKNLEDEFLGVTQPTYYDDSGALGMFSNVKIYFNLL